MEQAQRGVVVLVAVDEVCAGGTRILNGSSIRLYPKNPISFPGGLAEEDIPVGGDWVAAREAGEAETDLVQARGESRKPGCNFFFPG